MPIPSAKGQAHLPVRGFKQAMDGDQACAIPIFPAFLDGGSNICSCCFSCRAPHPAAALSLGSPDVALRLTRTRGWDGGGSKWGGYHGLAAAEVLLPEGRVGDEDQGLESRQPQRAEVRPPTTTTPWYSYVGADSLACLGVEAVADGSECAEEVHPCYSCYPPPPDCCGCTHRT